VGKPRIADCKNIFEIKNTSDKVSLYMIPLDFYHSRGELKGGLFSPREKRDSQDKILLK